MRRYAVIVVDPPWQTMGGPLIRGVGEGFDWRDLTGRSHGPSRLLPYATMTVEEIATLPVASLAADDCALYLWTINAYVEHAYDVARAWGFKPSTLLTWCKAPMGGGLGGAYGISSEYVLYARKGSPVERRATGTWYGWKRHYINGKPAHSAKPDAFYDLVETVNDGPRVELFARRGRLGWDYWGDESLGTAELTT
jgi:N6-adenosine-specific RNA methylase IME4